MFDLASMSKDWEIEVLDTKVWIIPCGAVETDEWLKLLGKLPDRRKDEGGFFVAGVALAAKYITNIDGVYFDKRQKALTDVQGILLQLCASDISDVLTIITDTIGLSKDARKNLKASSDTPTAIPAGNVTNVAEPEEEPVSTIPTPTGQ